MSYYSSSDTFGNTVSTGLIVAAVLSAVFGIIFVIGSIVVVICIIKQCNKSRSAVANGGMFQPYAPYPNNIPNYPPQFPSPYPPPYPPPYNPSAPEFTKAPVS